MSKTNCELSNKNWEHREHREQPLYNGALDGPSAKKPLGMNGNKDASDQSLIEPLIPRPCYMCHKESFLLNGRVMKEGVYWHAMEEESVTATDIWICSPLVVKAMTSSTDDDNYGRLLEFKNTNGRWRQWAMPMILMKGNCDELRGELLHFGVLIDPKQKARFTGYLFSQDPSEKIISMSSIGWYKNTFVLPNQVIGDENVVFQAESNQANDFNVNGTLEGWNNDIGKYCEGNIPLIISIGTALAGPLLHKLHRTQSPGIHWVGDSSCGKTTAIEVASSIWGGASFLRTWRATSNGLEGIAASRNGTCIILDEIDQAEPKSIGEVIYTLGNGHGKQRAKRNGMLRTPKNWLLTVLSTGEKTLESIIKSTGKQANCGQSIRLLNVPAIYEHGIYSNLHGFSNGQGLSDHLKSARLKHYGHVGPAFIQHLIDDKRDLTQYFADTLEKFTGLADSNLQKRAASSFAIIGFATELAIGYGLLSLKQGDGYKASILAYERWKNSQSNDLTEDERIIQNIREYVNKHGELKFTDIRNGTDSRPSGPRAGWYKSVRDKRVYMFYDHALIEASGDYPKQRIIKALQKFDCIVDSDKDRYTKKTYLGPERRRENLYHILLPDD